ncbi:17571_t:CDS:1, partial [Funneliformis caledonium]
MKKCYQEGAFYEIDKLYYIENSNYTRRRKNQQQHEVAKGTQTLYTFWDIKKPIKEINKELADKTNIEELDDENKTNIEESDDKIENYN